MRQTSKSKLDREKDSDSGSADRFERGGEVGGEGLLGFFAEFGVVAGEVEDVDGGFAFGVDERHLDVALVAR